MKFTGIMPALVTPLDENERLCEPALKKLIDSLISRGADGFYVGGATGEGLAVRIEERMRLAEAAVAAADGRVPCIVQVANTDLSAAKELARHAERCGAAAISATPPIFFQYSEDDVYNYYSVLAGSTSLPLMAYNTPAAMFPMSAKFAARLYEIDNVTAIKWTLYDYYQMMMVKELTHGEMNVINGPDEMLLMGLAAGADGGIGTTYNFMLEIYRGIYDSFQSGDIGGARKYQYKAAKIISVLKEYPIIPATKALLRAQGFEVGEATAPMRRFTDGEISDMLRKMREAGLEI